MPAKKKTSPRSKQVRTPRRSTRREEKLFAATRQRAKASGDEMDEALGRKPKRQPGTAEVEASVRALAEKVESLDPIGKPLKPSAPCKPPDMLGAPGAHPDPGRNC